MCRYINHRQYSTKILETEWSNAIASFLIHMIIFSKSNQDNKSGDESRDMDSQRHWKSEQEGTGSLRDTWKLFLTVRGGTWEDIYCLEHFTTVLNE